MMTIGELKKIIEGIPESREVVISGSLGVTGLDSVEKAEVISVEKSGGGFFDFVPIRGYKHMPRIDVLAITRRE